MCGPVHRMLSLAFEYVNGKIRRSLQLVSTWSPCERWRRGHTSFWWTRHYAPSRWRLGHAPAHVFVELRQVGWKFWSWSIWRRWLLLLLLVVVLHKGEEEEEELEAAPTKPATDATDPAVLTAPPAVAAGADAARSAAREAALSGSGSRVWTNHRENVRRVSEPIWCADAKGTGTCSSRVLIPRLTWTPDMASIAFAAMRALAGRGTRLDAAYRAETDARVVIASTRWFHCTMVSCSKTFFQRGWMCGFTMSSGIHCPPIVGNSS
mmetsp:Transcript_2671/g.5077  ORF Transcript_2671/g.5077 Transcript_2671/m.5077 type:complete len:265 (-) Transcript_2671:603-1397(-)